MLWGKKNLHQNRLKITKYTEHFNLLLTEQRCEGAFAWQPQAPKDIQGSTWTSQGPELWVPGLLQTGIRAGRANGAQGATSQAWA